jgi:hypothetical protein
MVPKSRRSRFSRLLLTLAVCWQLLLIGMPLAKGAASEGAWEPICSISGMSKVWVNSDKDSNNGVTVHDECRICLLSHHLMATNELNLTGQHSKVPYQSIVFNSSYLNRIWSEQATGPPQPL